MGVLWVLSWKKEHSKTGVEKTFYISPYMFKNLTLIKFT